MKHMKAVLFLMIFLLAPSLALAESITLTTYYPSPYGSYDRLKISPRTTAPTCATTADLGIMYVDATDNNTLKQCSDPGGAKPWIRLGSLWELNGDGVFLDPNNFTVNPRVGIGHSATIPDGTLEIVNLAGANPLLVSSNEAASGDFMTVDSGGDVGLGTNSPNSQLTIIDNNGAVSTPIMDIVDDTGEDVMVVDDDGVNVTGIIKVNEDAAGNTLVQFKSAGIGEFTMGIDAGGDFVINNGPDITTTPALTIDPATGQITIFGPLNYNDGTNTGPIQLDYVGGGFYATYAP